ncbi:MAG: S49 family peptidase [Reyranellaceae bacterium]
MIESRLLSILTLRRWRDPAPLVAVVRLQGVIAPSTGFRATLSLAGLATTLQMAFSLRGARAVALQINSPGGSPVQSALIAARIRALAGEKNLPVYAFVEDVAASGGYWLACTADEIYADANSIVGSIGVISSSFGLDEFIARHGVRRRVYTAGEHKGMLDPFLPENPDDVQRLKSMQAEIHENFKAEVRARRGRKLKEEGGELFSGAFWTGTRARELGLVDGIGDLRSVMRSHFGPRVVLRLVGMRRGWLRRTLMRNRVPSDLMADATRAPVAALLSDGLLAALEERAWWSRYGL